MGGNRVNKLAGEASPYLLQHAENPVNWHPWGEEAFASAKEQNKPILLSIGYSTCHWCHVMAHESFEDNEVAALMNEAFIAIKVDREERPDIDNIYMTVCQMMTGRGGWPLTILMTPDKEPFFAGTYIPKEGRFGQVGLMELIPRMQAAWEQKPERIRETVKNIMEALHRAQAGTSGKLDATHLTLALTHYRATYDSANGGFRGKPKFPAAHQLLFLLRQWNQTGQDDLLGMVNRTLEAMRLGGIYDHVGYGFHRYSTDEKWLVPHFEKMLYDQAMLMMAYTEGYQATGSSNFAQTVGEIAEYISRDMTSPHGAFFSAEDADSDGEEGKFYVWSHDELGSLLNADEIAFIEKYFQAANDGNFIDESTGKSTGLNILHLSQFLPAENADEWKTIRRKLSVARENRIRPGRDDKILTDWNGLMIAALAKAGAALGVEQYVTQAAAAMEFIMSTMRRDDGLLHRYRNGDAGIDGTLEDYAYLGWGLLELYFATFEAQYLKLAMEITDHMILHFHDEAAGGFYFSADDSEPLLIRSKEYYDGAIPSGNSVAAYNLIRLARLTGQSRYEELAAATCASVAVKVEQAPTAFAWLLATVDFGRGPSYEVVIAGDRDSADTQAMLKALGHRYHPNVVTLLHEPGAQGEQISALSPLVAAQLPIDGKATAYVCQNFTCDRPVTRVKEMMENLGAV